jgi:hypothetical protein
MADKRQLTDRFLRSLPPQYRSRGPGTIVLDTIVIFPLNPRMSTGERVDV